MHTFHSDYMHVLGSYISLQKDFLTFLTTVRAEYDFCLEQAGQGIFDAVSVQQTLTGTIEEVCVCVQKCHIGTNTSHPLSQGPDFRGQSLQILYRAYV